MRRRTAVLAATLLQFTVAANARAQGNKPTMFYELTGTPASLFTLNAKDGWITRVLQLNTSSRIAGSYPMIVVPILFSDSDAPIASAATLQGALFDNPGTIGDFYREASRGALNVVGTVVPWAAVNVTKADATSSSDNRGIGERLGDAMAQALQITDATIDFGRFDNDGADGTPNTADDNGVVDGLVFIYNEIGANCGGTGTWPHMSSLTARIGKPYQTNDRRPNGDPIVVNGYLIISARDCAGAITKPAILAHEIGHFLGVRDYYSNALLIADRRWVTGCYDLMAAGSWGCGSGAPPSSFGPVHMNPQARAQLGWLNYDSVKGEFVDREFVLEPSISSGRALRIPLLPVGSTEAFVIEYRPRSGFDINLPTQGVLIYRENLSPVLVQPASGPRLFPFSLLEADGDDALRLQEIEGGNRGASTDAFGINGGTALSATTTARSAHVDGSPSTVTIHSIVISNGIARLHITSLIHPRLLDESSVIPLTALGPVSGTRRIVGGALPYFIQSFSAPRGMVFQMAGEDLLMTGIPLEAGDVEATVQIMDARAQRSELRLLFRIATVVIESSRIANTLFGIPRLLTEDEATYVDATGNRNGRIDVGDLRAHMLAAPGN